MNSKVFNFLMIVLFLSYSFSAEAVVMVKKQQSEVLQPLVNEQIVESVVVVPTVVNSKKQSRVAKRVKRVMQRILKKNNSFGSIWRSSKFKWGCLLLLLGIVGAILVNLFSLAQIFGWLTGILAVVGLAFMMWGLIDHS